MRILIAAALGGLLTQGLGAPASADTAWDITRYDPRGDVHVKHSGFAGNNDIDIRRAYYQYLGHGGEWHFWVELKLRDVRPDLDTAQLYTTEFLADGRRFRAYANDGDSGSLYEKDDGVWRRLDCQVIVDLNRPYITSGTNVYVKVDRCWSGRRLKVLYTRTENYYGDSMNDLAASDRLAVNEVIGRPRR